MIMVCAWCRTKTGKQDIQGENDMKNDITHGICRACLKWLRKNHDRNLREFLDSFDFPIFAIDSEKKVEIANNTAKEALGKSLSEIEGQNGGDAIECAHARLPEGCGHTMHCKACTIRNTVSKTHETGESFSDIPAYQEIFTKDGIKTIAISISTIKINDLVLLNFKYI